jgi:hypothetical protein
MATLRSAALLLFAAVRERKALNEISTDSDRLTPRLRLQHPSVFQNCYKDNKHLSLRTHFREHGNTRVATREPPFVVTHKHSLLTITSDISVRTLQGAAYASGTAMTDEACIAFCQSKNMYWAGTEYSAECYCGNTLLGGNGPAANQADCNMACSGMIFNFGIVLLTV